jgi:glutamate dehydrogenase/leucine dehydrogenase
MIFDMHPEYRRALTVAAIPERTIQFRVTWENDRGEVCQAHQFRASHVLPIRV